MTSGHQGKAGRGQPVSGPVRGIGVHVHQHRARPREVTLGTERRRGRHVRHGVRIVVGQNADGDVGRPMLVEGLLDVGGERGEGGRHQRVR